MSQSNFVIRDVVQYIPEKHRHRHSVRRSMRRMIRKMWLYLIIVGVSCGVGFIAVFLPDITKSMSPIGGGMGNPEKMRDFVNMLSDEQKQTMINNMSAEEKAQIKKSLGLGGNE